ncbi:MAG: segregation/condensation protein A [Spirochaetes bacterium]|nr:segregation/condensation protein A [Spirochaetota bacterium]
MDMENNKFDEIIDNSEETSVDSEKYQIHIENFDGPLDLLWALIKKSKIDIVDVSLSKITEQYLQYLRMMDELNVNLASEFINMASELIYYKSRILLPAGEIDDEYFVPPLPPELVQKLLEYKKYQQATSEMMNLYELQSDSYVRKSDISQFIDNEEYTTMSLFDLLNAFVEVLGTQKKVEEREIKFDEILVSDRIDHIIAFLRKQEKITFKELFKTVPSISMVVATFLAVLELTKVQKIKIMQNKAFGTIFIFRSFNPDQEIKPAEFNLTSAG